ncbi:MAG: hypothetical protein IIX20_06175, partial [Alistipes sp.]|nr:hypothetical protein [Alistipes sp.]
YQAIRQMPKVELEQIVAIEKTSEQTWSGTVVVKNNSQTPALMIRINLLGEEDGDQILPVFYSDNYFSLLPGEQKSVSFRFKDEDTRGTTPKIVVTGYNVQ